jgi:hypothetical protein
MQLSLRSARSTAKEWKDPMFGKICNFMQFPKESTHLGCIGALRMSSILSIFTQSNRTTFEHNQFL